MHGYDSARHYNLWHCSTDAGAVPNRRCVLLCFPTVHILGRCLFGWHFETPYKIYDTSFICMPVLLFRQSAFVLPIYNLRITARFRTRWLCITESNCIDRQLHMFQDWFRPAPQAVLVPEARWLELESVPAMLQDDTQLSLCRSVH